MASDLEDTRGWDTNFDLAGAAVLVMAFEAEDPTSPKRLTWLERFQHAGAGAIYFRDVSEPPENALDLLFASAGMN